MTPEQIIRLCAEALEAYEVTYMRTQTHPSVSQEAAVMAKVAAALEALRAETA